MFLKYEYGGNIYQVEINREGNKYFITYDDDVYTVTAKEIEKGFLNISLGDRVIKCVVSSIDETKYVFHQGDVYEVRPIELTGKKLDDAGDSPEKEFKSPISGRVVKVPVKEGDRVKTGDVLMIIEAMKMEYLIKAPWDGKIIKINFSQGEQIDIGRETLQMSKEE